RCADATSPSTPSRPARPLRRCSSTASPSRRSTPCATCPPWNGSASPMTSPRPSPSWPVPPGGSTARSSTPMEDWSEMSTQKVVLVTGASSGFGAMTVRALADAKHVVHAGMRDIGGRNAQAAEAVRRYAAEHSVTLRPIEMVIHNAGHMVLGPTEAFTPEQVAAVYDTNVLSTQRVNRAVLPAMRAQRDGLVLWVGSSSSRGGTPPYLGPYFAAK